MTAAMLAYGVVAAGVVALGSWGLATVFRMARIPERGVWLGGLLLVVVVSVLPLALSPGPRTIASTAVDRFLSPTSLSGRSAAEPGGRLGTALSGLPLDREIPWFLAAWAGASGAMVLLGLGLEWRHRRHLRRLRRSRLCGGLDVWMGPHEGPTVCGAVAPRLVLPERIGEMRSDERRLLLRHEIEHLRARDPALNGLSLALLTTVPWNPFAWVLRRWLVRAIESDCDQRVLRSRYATPRPYVDVLLTVASWRPDPPPAPSQLAMGRSAHDLRERLNRILRPSLPRSAGAVAGMLLLGVGTVTPSLADPPTRAGERLATTLILGPAPAGAGAAVEGAAAFTLVPRGGRVSAITEVLEGDPEFEARARRWLESAPRGDGARPVHVWVAASADGGWRAAPVAESLYAARGLDGSPEATRALLRSWARLSSPRPFQAVSRSTEMPFVSVGSFGVRPPSVPAEKP